MRRQQRSKASLAATAARRLCLPPHPRLSVCCLVRVVVLSAAQFTHHFPVVNVVCAWTTMRLAGHTAVLGAGGSLVIVVYVRLHCPRYLARSWSTGNYHQRTSSLYD